MHLYFNRPTILASEDEKEFDPLGICGVLEYLRPHPVKRTDILICGVPNLYWIKALVFEICQFDEAWKGVRVNLLWTIPHLDEVIGVDVCAEFLTNPFVPLRLRYRYVGIESGSATGLYDCLRYRFCLFW